MKNIILLFFCLFIVSCTFRSYNLTFNYYVGNNGTSDITFDDYEKYKEEVAKANEENLTNEEKVINIPEGSGNLTIYIQAEVPKHIETQAEAKLTPLQNSLLGLP
jgi:hypothetical protein